MRRRKRDKPVLVLNVFIKKGEERINDVESAVLLDVISLLNGFGVLNEIPGHPVDV